MSKDRTFTVFDHHTFSSLLRQCERRKPLQKAAETPLWKSQSVILIRTTWGPPEANVMRCQHGLVRMWAKRASSSSSFNLLEYINPTTDPSPLLPHPTNHHALGIPLPSA